MDEKRKRREEDEGWAKERRREGEIEERMRKWGKERGVGIGWEEEEGRRRETGTGRASK